jgi:nitrate/TMAO reductase-like tetraheme cytochrome c subunit
MRSRWVAVCVLVVGMSSVFAVGEDELPPGKMQAKVKAACTQCHTVSNITKKPRTKAEWSKVLDKMTGYGADVDDKDRDAILDYLSTNFGPGKTASSKQSKSEKSDQ